MQNANAPRTVAAGEKYLVVLEDAIDYARRNSLYPSHPDLASCDYAIRELRRLLSQHAHNAPTAAQVERAARAMCEWDDVYNNAMRGIGPWASLIEHTREHYRSQARAALTTALAAPAPVAAGGACPEGAQGTGDLT